MKLLSQKNHLSKTPDQALVTRGKWLLSEEGNAQQRGNK